MVDIYIILMYTANMDLHPNIIDLKLGLNVHCPMEIIIKISDFRGVIDEECHDWRVFLKKHNLLGLTCKFDGDRTNG